MNTNNRKNSNGLSFLAGLIVGGATLYYLNTPHGKEMTKKAKAKGVEYTNIAKETAVDLTNQAKSKANDLANQAQKLANELKAKAEETYVTGKEKLADATSTIKHKVEDILPDSPTTKDFKKGVERAKANLKNGVKA